MELKNNLRKLRFVSGEMTQEELATALDVSRQTIHSIESGKFNPSVKLALAMAKLFKVSVEEIFYFEEE
ncbi:MAG: helix-turn-helix transcriptional regulator [Candidatus Wallbacteria bacterium]